MGRTRSRPRQVLTAACAALLLCAMLGTSAVSSGLSGRADSQTRIAGSGMSHASTGVGFRDDFDGMALDSDKWVSFTNGGTVVVEESLVKVDRGYGGSFPYIHTVLDPFPVEDFVVKIRMRYTSAGPRGTGVQLARYLPSNQGIACTFDPSVASGLPVAAIWEDDGVVQVAHPDRPLSQWMAPFMQGNSVPVGSAPESGFHTYEIRFSGGIISISVDGGQPTGSTTMAGRPHVLWFGNPSVCPLGNWSGFEIDYIEVKGVSPTLTAVPGPVPADGASASVVTLSGAPAGHQIRLISSRGSVDAFSPPAGTTDASGTFVASLRSSTPGTAILTVKDLTTGQVLGASASVAFTPMDGPAPPANQGAVVIARIDAEHPLDATYLEGISVDNRIDVRVNWQGLTPGRVDFVLDGTTHSQVATSVGASHTFDMGNELQVGSNTLRIIAYGAAGEASEPRDFVPRLVSAPVWLYGLQQAGLISLPLLASGDWAGKASYEAGFHFPAYKFSIDGPGFGVPDGRTGLDWSFEGKIKLPLDCSSPFEASFSLGADNAFSLLGGEIGMSGEAGLKADRVEVCALELPHGFAKVEVEGTWTVVRKPVLVMIAYFNTAVGVAVDNIVVVLHIEELVAKVLGEFYIDGKAHVGVESDVTLLNESPYWRLENLSVEGGIGIEGGYRVKSIIEAKIYAGADGTVERLRPGPVAGPPVDEWHFDKLTLKGEVGAKFRAGWFEREAKGAIEWTYPPAEGIVQAMAELSKGPWQLVGHGYGEAYSVFHGSAANQRSPFRSSDVIAAEAVATASEVLVSNVYTYTEPTLALNPSDDHALLVWVHDDVGKPLGQNFDLACSSWDGSTWSPPDRLTDDTYLDGAPQVAWDGSGQGVAIWERLNDPALPVTATLDITTMNKVEVAWSGYDAVTKTWRPTAWLTTNSALDHKPVLGRSASGGILAVWRQNAAGQVSGNITDTDSILYATWSGTGWTAPAAAVQQIPGLSDLAVGNGAGQATIAYTQLITATGATTPTLQLLVSSWDGSSWSQPQQLTDDELEHTNPQLVYNLFNQPLLVWQAGDSLVLRNLSTSAEATLELDSDLQLDEFHVHQDGSGNLAAVFTGQRAGQRDLFVAFYDAAHDAWGQPEQLTDDSHSEGYPAPALDSTGRLVMGYALTQLTPITRTATISDTGEVITYTMPMEGQTDLYTLSHTFAQDLTVGDLALSNDHPWADEAITVTATVTNSGALALSHVRVDLYDGDPAAGGVLIQAVTRTEALAGGFADTWAITYTVPATGGQHLLVAVVDPLGQIAEVDESNNQASLPALGPDLELVSAGVQYWSGSSVDLQVEVSNLGTTSSPTATVSYYWETISGTLAITDTLPPLFSGESRMVTTPWDYGLLATGTYTLAVVLNQDQSDFTETFADNNEGQLNLEVLPDLAVSPLYVWAENLPGGQVAITVTVYNFGSVAGGSTDVAIYVDNPLTDTARVHLETIPGLAAAGSTQVTATWQRTPGEHIIYVAVDPERTGQELTWANNLASASLPEASLLGGVNNDGLVDSTDALIILTADVGLDTTLFCPMNCGDVNADGFVDSTDALIVLTYDVGLSVPFPVGSGVCPASITQPPGCSP